MFYRSLLCAVLIVCVGCSMPKFSMPRVHKITVQQGNVISQQMIDQLKPGMTRSQVAYIMGEPVARNTFDDSRWDYIYTVSVPGLFEDEQRVSLYFENEVLAYFTGDLAPSESTEDETAETRETAATE